MPRSGALLFTKNFDRVLMVKHNWPNSWGFPQGKIDENEDPLECAIREIKEETSFDIRNLIDSRLFVEGICNGRKTILYIVQNVPSITTFHPSVRNEIKCYKWFSLNYLFRLDESATAPDQPDQLTIYAYHMIPQVKRFYENHFLKRQFKFIAVIIFVIFLVLFGLFTFIDYN